MFHLLEYEKVVRARRIDANGFCEVLDTFHHNIHPTRIIFFFSNSNNNSKEGDRFSTSHWRKQNSRSAKKPQKIVAEFVFWRSVQVPIKRYKFHKYFLKDNIWKHVEEEL
jgi:hypothetical protein